MGSQKYDQILPEKLGDAGWEGDAPCPECGGAGLAITWPDRPDERCPHCRGAGTVRVRLTEDPTWRRVVGWRHVGTVVTP